MTQSDESNGISDKNNLHNPDQQNRDYRNLILAEKIQMIEVTTEDVLNATNNMNKRVLDHITST